MTSWNAALAALTAAVLLWAAAVTFLLVTGRRSEARALAGLVPDCAVLLRRLLRVDRLSRGGKLAVLALLAYLALPVDLVPDFIPVAGQLDDVLVTALVLRLVLRSAGAPWVREHWPGPPESLAVVMRLAFFADGPASTGRPAHQPSEQQEGEEPRAELPDQRGPAACPPGCARV